jgi:uncharacterized protein (TIGR00369 family)
MVTVKPGEKLDSNALLKEIIEKIPFNNLIGFKVYKIDEKGPSIKFDMKEKLVGNFYYGILHGGVISAALDLIGGFTSFHALLLKLKNLNSIEKMERLTRLATIDLRVDYLIPGKGNYFIAKGKILRLGNKVAVSRMELVNDKNDLIALGTGTYNVG